MTQRVKSYYDIAAPKAKGDDGRYLCRNAECRKPITGRGWSFCSHSCRDEVLAQTGASVWIRSIVLRRDGGMCGTCGADARLQHRLVRAMRKLSTPTEVGRFADEAWGVKDWTHDGGYWQVDHVIPVVEGGSSKLENLRTLCTACHKAETRELARRRALRRRTAGTLFEEAA